MDEEIKVIIQILHKYFTDEPGDVINEAVQNIKNTEDVIKSAVKRNFRKRK